MPVCETDFTKHQFDDDYYGIRCVNCGLYIPFGCEPWAPLDDDETDDDDDDHFYYDKAALENSEYDGDDEEWWDYHYYCDCCGGEIGEGFSLCICNDDETDSD